MNKSNKKHHKKHHKKQAIQNFQFQFSILEIQMKTFSETDQKMIVVNNKHFKTVYTRWNIKWKSVTADVAPLPTAVSAVSATDADSDGSEDDLSVERLWLYPNLNG